MGDGRTAVRGDVGPQPRGVQVPEVGVNRFDVPLEKGRVDDQDGSVQLLLGRAYRFEYRAFHGRCLRWRLSVRGYHTPPPPCLGDVSIRDSSGLSAVCLLSSPP